MPNTGESPESGPEHDRAPATDPFPVLAAPDAPPPPVAPAPDDSRRDAASVPMLAAFEHDWVTAARRPRSRRNWRPAVLAGAAVAAVAAVVVGLTWLAGNSAPPSATPPLAEPTTITSTTAPQPDPVAAEARLRALLPRGYPPGTCLGFSGRPETGGVLVELRCGPNADPDGPTGSIYRLTADTAALQETFEAVADRLDVVECPGRIQSPGPWRRTADPGRQAGIVVCGTGRGEPVLAWSDTAGRFVAEVRTTAGADGLDQLYRWWSTHS